MAFLKGTSSFIKSKHQSTRQQRLDFLSVINGCVRAFFRVYISQKGTQRPLLRDSANTHFIDRRYCENTKYATPYLYKWGELLWDLFFEKRGIGLGEELADVERKRRRVPVKQISIMPKIFALPLARHPRHFLREFSWESQRKFYIISFHTQLETTTTFLNLATEQWT